jgi:hypothetical protein
LPVTVIGEWAFSNAQFSSVTIPNSVTIIGDNAFWASQLTSVTIPNSVTSIGNYAFYGSQQLASVNFGNSLRSIGAWAFSGGNKLTSVTIPDSVTSIGRAFSWGHEGGSPFLTSVSIGAGLTEGLESAFYRSPLKEIRVDPRNTRYAVRDGMLYSKDFTVLILCPPGKKITQYTIPADVTSIADYAFGWNELTSVTIPDSVTSIGDGAFASNKLTRVSIGAEVTILINIEEPGQYPSFDDELGDYYYANDKKAGTYTLRGNTWSYSAR